MIKFLALANFEYPSSRLAATLVLVYYSSRDFELKTGPLRPYYLGASTVARKQRKSQKRSGRVYFAPILLQEEEHLSVRQGSVEVTDYFRSFAQYLFRYKTCQQREYLFSTRAIFP